MLAVLSRALTYATLFIGFVLVFLPAQVLARSGVSSPVNWGAGQIIGMALCAIGASIAIWCILALAVLGRGTPAPFDPPRQLVIRGPYRYVRNPMYIGAGLALTGAALFYQAAGLLAYAAGFLIVMHLFVVLYEEPTLRKTFHGDYDSYCQHVHRWWPTRAERQGSWNL